MPFRAIRGQDTAVATLTRALASGLVHHAYRFEGPDGVGKELAAVAFAQALLCSERGCRRCEICRRVATVSSEEPRVPLHPDFVVVERGLYPPAVIGRSTQEVSEISVNQVRRVILTQAGYAPHEGRARVFLIRAAENLRVEAANALLKTLEEPRPGTHFVLLTASPDRLLDTVRSRSLPVRFGPLPNEVVADILRARGVPAERIEAAVELSGGSASAALEAADPEQTSERDAFVAAVLRAVDATALGSAVALAEGAERDRQALALQLRALAAHYAQRGRNDVRRAPRAAELAARRHALVLEAIDTLGTRNASAALLLSTLVVSLRRAWPLRREGAPPIPQPRR